ncbi:MAG: AmmeMemoRadiSam system protein A [Myxococcota bacterium]|nr:AmmeMemoRadiSam system protein A [Myxococcota bacterium]
MSSREPGARGGQPSLCAVAREAIAHGLREGGPPPIDPADYDGALRRPGASFVTLRRAGELRGCTGSLEATRPLVCDVARNAWRSAFGDPRFEPLCPAELDDLEISVSVLSPLEPFAVGSRQELLDTLRPGVDGLVLREGPRSATFLPSVWKSLPEPRAFLAALLQKAGLPPAHWSPQLRFERYTTHDTA